MSALVEEPDPIQEVLGNAARLLVPFARMYLGSSIANIRELASGQAADTLVLQYAFSKLVLEAGTLPAPETAYAPHSTRFTIDERGYAPALDLPFILAAVRAGAAWASAPGPEPQTSDANAGAPQTSSASYSPVSARELRMTARARSYAAMPPNTANRTAATTRPPAPTGGCGCRGARTRTSVAVATATPASPSVRWPSRARTRGGCADPQPRCDCGGTCGGTGCGCSGTTSCTDCIPRGASAGDLCTCGTCTPPSDICTPWWPSCAMRNRLRACLKEILCELLACIEGWLCAARVGGVGSREASRSFANCLSDLICKLLRCIREAICPPACAPLPQPVDCLPCSYAVEES